MKEKAQDPLVARQTDFCLSDGLQKNDTCKSSSVLVVSTLVAFMFSLCFCCVSANRLFNDKLSLLHIIAHNHGQACL